MKIIECDKEHKEKWNNAIYNRNYYIEQWQTKGKQSTVAKLPLQYN